MAFVDSLLNTGPTSANRVTAPNWPARTAAVVCLVAIALLVWRPNTPALVVGYVLGAVACPALAVVHRFMTENRRKSPWYVRTSGSGRVLLVAVLTGVAVGVLHAWLLATELAKI